MQNEMIFDVVVEEGCYMPESAHDDDAGYDLRTPAPFILCPGESVTVDTGVWRIHQGKRKALQREKIRHRTPQH